MNRCFGTVSYALEKSKAIAPKCWCWSDAKLARWMKRLNAICVLCIGLHPFCVGVSRRVTCSRTRFSTIFSRIFPRLQSKLIGL